ncbi:MAG TPA: hypothetical protein VGL93_19925 [Streptosporangiaceae bacterium]
MTRTVRLGWETRLDQLTLAVNIAILGVGLILVGAFGLAGAVGDVLLIVLGALLCLFDGLRLLGWRSLLWPRTLTAGPDGVADDSKKGHGFGVTWSGITALGVCDDRSADDSRGLVLVVYPSAGADPATFGPGLVSLSGDGAGPLVARLPRRRGVVAALRAAAPDIWPRAEREPWAVLLTAPGMDTEIVPPRAEPAVTVNVSRRLARQGLVGAVLAAFFGVSAMVAAFGGGPAPTGQRIAVAAVGAPFVLIALALVLGGPVMIRRRRIRLDSRGFTWDDPTEESFTVAWPDLSAVSIETRVYQTRSTGDRHGVRVILEPKAADFGTRYPTMAKFADGPRYVIPLGDQPRAAQTIAAAIERLAPGIWRGTRTEQRSIGLT